MAGAAIGLTPIFPIIEVVPVVEIPAFDKITKLPAVPRFTAAVTAEALLVGPLCAASVLIGPARPSTIEMIAAAAIELFLIVFIFLIDYPIRFAVR